MRIDRIILWPRLALFSILTFALVATGFGHRTPSSQDAALAFLAANGGTLVDFCGDAPGDGPRGQHCLACQITAGADLPPPCGAVARLPGLRTAGLTAANPGPALPPAKDPAHPPQGPPVA